MSEEGLAKEAALFPVKKALQVAVLLRPDRLGRQGLPRRDVLSCAQSALRRRLHLLPEGRDQDGRGGASRRRGQARQGRPARPLPRLGQAAQGGDRGEAGVILIVTDEAGQVVRRITAPPAKGLHRVAWNLRYPGVEPTQLESARREAWERDPFGPMVVPGRLHRQPRPKSRTASRRRSPGLRPSSSIRSTWPACRRRTRPPSWSSRDGGSCNGR